ncbi:MAG TPA: carotenoid oxygenase family protein, partial [Thermoanaerobaculia bacterium]|nr:carotenoid oxygenase family protein [Thermoanaerobaculia bacterium]
MNEPARFEPLADNAPGLERAFADTPAERVETIRPADIEGEVPAFVRGTYYLNGPARFSRGDVRYRHWLDGDGMICALRFGADGVELRARFVQSPKWQVEEAAGKALFRAFGTSFSGDRLVRGIALESPVNVSVYPFGGALLAFGEQGLPIAIDPETLETRG